MKDFKVFDLRFGFSRSKSPVEQVLTLKNFIVVLLVGFPDFEVWVKDFKVFDLRFRFLVKNSIYFTPGTPQNRGGANFHNRGRLLTGPRG